MDISTLMTDEKTLMLQVQQGQIDKLAILFENNHVALFNYFLRHGTSRAVSEDLVQETFVKVLAYRSSFSGSGSFRSWMFGIARNTMADQYRGLSNTAPHLDIEEHEVPAVNDANSTLFSGEKQNIFQQALRQLPVELRDIVILSRFHQLNYEDLSKMVGCNLNTFKSRMQKALNMLRSNVQELMGEDG